MANIPLLRGRRRVIRVDLETTQGTVVDPPTTELLTFDARIQPEDNMDVREPDQPYAGRIKSSLGPQVCTVTFRCELRSDGTDSLDAGLEIIFQCCGFGLSGSVLSPETSVASQKTCTIGFWRDGHYELAVGCAGTFELAGEYGGRVMLDVTMNGIYSPQTDEAMPEQSHASAVPMRAKGATWTIGAYTPLASRFSINPNNDVEVREDLSATHGVLHYYVGGRNVQIGFDPEDKAAATHDYRGLWLATTESAFSLLLSDGDVNVTIAAPKLQYMPPQENTRDSKLIYDLVGQCNMDDGDDELTITTAAAA